LDRWKGVKLILNNAARNLPGCARGGNRSPLFRFIIDGEIKELAMTVKGEIKEAAGFVKEEAHEHGKSPDSQRKAQEGRDLRNEGRVEDGKAPKTTKPGTGH
jgi:hypothetical protein